MKELNKKLFAFDLDGTLLSDSKESIIPNNVKNTIKLLQKKGHIVCLFTGRPWRATKKIYDELKLDTMVVNYNGAHIHHPKEYGYIPIVERISISSVMRILSSKEFENIAENIVVEGPSYLHIKNNVKSYFTQSFIKEDKNTKITSPINYELMNSDPTGVLIEIKKEYSENIGNIRSYFRAAYGDLASFTYWDTGKENNPILEFTNYLARKDMALIKVARYYGISMSNTIAFGDGYNDVKMLKVAGLGVAMSNASDVVKTYANVVSKHSNKDGGVAKFIDWYINGGHNLTDKTIYSIDSKAKILKNIVIDD